MTRGVTMAKVSIVVVVGLLMQVLVRCPGRHHGWQHRPQRLTSCSDDDKNNKNGIRQTTLGESHNTTQARQDIAQGV